MKALKNSKFLVLAVGAVLTLASCGGQKVPEYKERDDKEIFDRILGDYQKLHDEAAKIADDSDRYVKYAEAEAELLDAAVMSPYQTQGGNYAITRAAPRTVPYVLYGNDEDRLKNIVAAKDENKFITKAERAELLQKWQTAREGGAAYDPAAYLTSKGYTLATDYTTTFATAPATLDILNTSEQSDSEVLVNMIESLVEYDNLGVLHGRLAKEQANGLPYTVSADGLTYTFEVKAGAKWVTADGNVYGDVTADDFVAGFQHMLDCQAGLEFLFQDVIVGVNEYLNGEPFANVGYKAEGNKVIITLVKPESFFVTRLAYSCSSPLNRAFFLSRGGAFGVSEFATASAAATYKYGIAGDMNSMVYNAAFYPIQWDVSESTGTIKLKKNPHYDDAAKVTMNSLTWVYNNGENMEQFYSDVKKGIYVGCSLSESTGTLEWAKNDGYFANNAYITDTNSTSYLMGLNLNRGTFVLENGAAKSKQSEAEKEAIWYAMQNKNFRKAILHGIDRAAWNAISRGEELAATNIRNIYTAPEFVATKKSVTIDGKTYPQGTSYGTLVQHFLDKKGAKIKAQDGVDGWYNPEYAVMCLEQAKKELGDKFPSAGLNLDNVYYSPSAGITANAQGFKQLLEKTLSSKGVKVSLIETTTAADYYAVGYRAKTGKDLGQDIFYGSGWGPDYADPSTYLDTFAAGGYMTKIIGIN